MRRAIWIVIFLLSVVGTVPLKAQGRITVAQIVEAATPSDIDITPQVAGPDSCSVVFSSMPDGTPQLVAAAYTNGVFGYLRMLSVDSQSLKVKVLGQVTRTQFVLAGAGCHMELINLHGTVGEEKRREAHEQGGDPLSQVLQIDFLGLSGQGAASWFFEWDGSKFVNLGPTELLPNSNRPPETALFVGGTVDLNHTGVLQIASNGEGDLHPDENTGIWNMPTILVWAFDGKSFVHERTLVELMGFDRRTGAPAPVLTDVTPDTCYAPACSEFELANPAPLYTLRITNGDADGKHRVSRGHVLLNNVEVVAPSDFKDTPEFIAKPVWLLQKNTLYASLEGRPGEIMNVAIEAPPTPNSVQVSASCSRMEPDGFSLGAIKEARENREKGNRQEKYETVHLNFGTLQDQERILVSAGEVDPATITVSPGLFPQHVGIHPRSEGDERNTSRAGVSCSQRWTGSVTVEISRQDLLKALPELHAGSPLKAGDNIEIKLSGKLKDGTPLSALFQAKILDDHEGSE